MSNGLPPLADFKKNVHSQYGEDGIIEEALRRISRVTGLDRWCVEFGAWDGRHLSNTRHLIDGGYKAVLIEGDPERYRELCKELPQDSVIKLERFVGFDGDASVDSLLRATPILSDFDLLSIDVDGCDYHFFESLKEFRPKLVCIEFNPSIPNDVEFVQARRLDVKQGASAKSLTMLARAKGYTLVAATFCNIFFVRDDLRAAVIGPAELALDQVRDDASCRTYLFSGYDGTLLLSRDAFVMPWHEFKVTQERLQVLPKFLRAFPDDYTVLQKLAFICFIIIAHPVQAMEKIRRRLARARRKP